MILLDTNVVSEFMRPLPAPEVQSWIRSQSPVSLFISAVTEAELRLGLELLPPGKRRDALEAALESMLAQEFAGRVLPFDQTAATAFAKIVADRRRAGRPIAQFDAQISSIARCRGASLATRNIGDFADCGIHVINPWKDQP